MRGDANAVNLLVVDSDGVDLVAVEQIRHHAFGVMPSMLTPQMAQEKLGSSDVCSFTPAVSRTLVAQ